MYSVLLIIVCLALFRLTIVVYVLQYPVYDYLFGIFKPYLTLYYHFADYRVVMILIMMITAFLCLLSSINAYRTGALAEIYQTMMPNHGATPETSVAPYRITITSI